MFRAALKVLHPPVNFYHHLFPDLGLTASTAWGHLGSVSVFGQPWILPQSHLQVRDTT